MRSVARACGFSVLGFGLLFACGGDEGGDDGGGGGSCVPTAAECYVSGPSGPGAACLAKADNTGQAKWQGRFTALDILGPKSLATPFMQIQVVDNGIELNQPTCTEIGDGTFTWLFEIDPAAKTLKTGGGLPMTDPKAGSCFVSLPTAALPVGPIEVPITIDQNDTHITAKDIDVNVPVFRTATDLTNPIILPLHSVDLDATFTDDSHNCIGSHRFAELEAGNNCRPDEKAVPPERAWNTAGTLDGYITVEEADQVTIDELGGATLCVVLAGGVGTKWNGPEKNCKSSTPWLAGERPEADWCSTTDSAATATCKDAYRLQGKFAAAGTKVTGNCP